MSIYKDKNDFAAIIRYSARFNYAFLLNSFNKYKIRSRLYEWECWWFDDYDDVKK